MSKYLKNDFKDVPPAIFNCFLKLVNGVEREVKRGGEVILLTEKDCTNADEDTMLRIMRNTSGFYWKKIASIFKEDGEQIAFFNSAWVAKINYDEYRFKTSGKGARRKELAKKHVSDILKNAERLLSDLNELSELGYRSVRIPDLNLLQPSLESELNLLIEKTKSFNLNRMHDEEFINYGISSNKACEKMEYLRGFVSLLNKHGFNLNDKNTIENAVVPVANAALGIDEVGYNDVYNVIHQA